MVKNLWYDDYPQRNSGCKTDSVMYHCKINEYEINAYQWYFCLLVHQPTMHGLFQFQNLMISMYEQGSTNNPQKNINREYCIFLILDIIITVDVDSFKQWSAQKLNTDINTRFLSFTQGFEIKMRYSTHINTTPHLNYIAQLLHYH